MTTLSTSRAVWKSGQTNEIHQAADVCYCSAVAFDVNALLKKLVEVQFVVFTGI